MKIVLHQSWEELQSVAVEWNRLLANSCSDTIFLTWEWCQAWWRAYGHGRSLCVLTAWENNELFGVGPFCADTSRSWHGKWICLRIIGAGSGDSDYLDCFTKPGFERQVVALFFEFLESIDRSWDWLEVEGAPQESSCLAAIAKIAAERGWSFACEDVPCASLSLPRKWDDYLRLLRPRVRTRIRSALAYFEQLGVEPTECTAGQELDTWLAQLFDIHTRRWQKRWRPGVFANEDRQSFYREVSRVALQKGWLALHRLTWCDRPLALQYGFRYHNRLYSLQEGYDPSFEKLRPGIALRGWVMRYEIQQGLTDYDFLAGTARHKLEWGARLKVSRIIRLTRKPSVMWMSMSMPAVSRSLRENASKLMPQSLRSFRARLIHSRRQRRWETSHAPIPLAKQVVRWSASHLYSDTPIGALSRELANRRAWRQVELIDNPHSSPVCTILRYHRVNDNGDPFFKAVPVSQFEAQMHYLARNFQFVSLNQLAGMHMPLSSQRYCVAITFDDGYRDNFVHAFPILTRFRIPATIFLTTGYIDSGNLPWYDHVRLAFKLTSRTQLSLQEFGGPGAILETEAERLKAMHLTLEWLRMIDDDKRQLAFRELLRNLRVTSDLTLPGTMLTWTQIRQMQKAGIEFGAHTVSHPVLRTLSASRLLEEIVDCKTNLESRLQVSARHFAYPFGKPADFSDAAKHAVRAAGFQTAVTTISGFNVPGQDLFELRRLNLEESDPAIFGLKFDWSRFSSPMFATAASV